MDELTREICQRCNRISPVGFHSPLWNQVAGRHWQDSILCVLCFAALGDEKFIRWEDGIEFYPVSFRSHREFVETLVPFPKGVGVDAVEISWCVEHDSKMDYGHCDVARKLGLGFCRSVPALVVLKENTQ